MKQAIIIGGILVFLSVALWLAAERQSEDATFSGTTTGLPEKIEFRYHVRPILSDKCFKCHGPDANKRMAGLRLDIEEEALAELSESPGKHAIIPGDPENSELITRIFTDDPSLIMPPPDSHLSLSEYEKEVLTNWIEQGAEYQGHWAFLPVERPSLPEVAHQDQAASEIDLFILGKLEEKGLSLSPLAPEEQLIRRLSLDLTGLPPTYEEIRRFSSGGDEAGYEEAVDHYLSSPAYGEHMARQWLDVARYADSHGYQDDSYRSMWPWRDWVIHAFNENMPYDRFLTWQLAGDLLPDTDKEKMLATGFNRNHPITQEGGVIDEEYRVAYVTDRTNTLGKGILGITLECAACHDHKYDPVSMKEYYGFFAFFNNVSEKGLQMDAVQAANRKYYADEPSISITDEEVASILDFINKPDTGTVKVMVMNDSLPRQAYVLERGQYDAHGEQVLPGTPEAILPFPQDLPANRLGLAQWLVSRENPLTARVFVNRLWMMLFGRGIVETVEDFGSQGALPSHPELLDWLAAEFMENGWDIKELLKKIVMSNTYRQQSVITPDLKEKDPENIYLARAPRFRMDAEMIRDYILKTSGLLNPEIGGPSVKPYQPPGLWEETNAGGNRGILTTYVQDQGDDLYRRSLYTFWKRTLPPPAMTIFDAPTRDLCEVRRQVTNTPLQALAVMNDVQVLEASRVLAESVLEDAGPGEQLDRIFEKVLLRKPDAKELSILRDYYEEVSDDLRNDPEKAARLLEAGQYEVRTEDRVRAASLMLTAQVIYNLDETISKE